MLPPKLSIWNAIVGKRPGAPKPPSKYPPTAPVKSPRYERRAVSMLAYDNAPVAAIDMVRWELSLLLGF